MTEVSVVIPCHNRAGPIRRAVESVLRQSLRQEIEIVVVDDGSSDRSALIVDELARQDQRVRLVRHATQQGAQAARNTGIKEARGTWVAFLDSDDEYLQDSLSARLSCAARTKTQVVHSECLVLRPGQAQAELFGVFPLQGSVYRQLLASPGPVFPALLIKREALARIGFLDEQIQAWQEWDTAIRLARVYQFGFVPEPTFVYDCRHASTISKNLVRSAQGYEQIVKKHLLTILRRLGPAALAYHYGRTSEAYYRAGCATAGRRCHLIATGWKLVSPSLWKRRILQVLRL
jgi:glycosyltransferase involved in cell wall biosynthesis